MNKRTFFKHVMAAVATVALAPEIAFGRKLERITLASPDWIEPPQLWNVFILVKKNVIEDRTFELEQLPPNYSALPLCAEAGITPVAGMKLLHTRRYDLSTTPATITDIPNGL